MGGYTCASNKKECVGEKWERMVLRKDLSLPRKLRENYKKVNCRRININTLWQYFRDNSVDLTVVSGRLVLAVEGLLEEEWKDMKREGPQRNFYAQERVLRQLPLFVGICKLENQTVLKGSREGWKEIGLLRTWGRKWNFCPPVFPQKWLISHLAHEKVSVQEWVNFVYCFWYVFFQNQSLVSIVLVGRWRTVTEKGNDTNIL